ncbi:MAG: DUF4097 family beta strand repeat-containing protein [Acidobacteriota bacterium]|nr:DUF4097 family beta strand repeat-containing protein [Acidobacteriota bacterium]
MKTKKVVITLALMIAAVGFAWSATTVNESHPVPAGAEIDIENIAGSLTIIGWDAAEVQVEGTLGDGVEGLDVDVYDDGVSIEVDYDEDYHGRQVTSTDLVIRLPASSPVSVETISSSIEVSGVRADVSLETVSGKVHVADMPASLDVENVSGGISVDSAPHDTDLESVSGAIRVGTAQGGLSAENVSGSILIDGGTLFGADFETVSGDITCNAVPGSQGDIDMETMSGTITLLVEPGAAASYDIETFSGSIVNQFGPEPKKTSKYTPEKELRFNTGTGGPSISLSSFSGTIKLMTR